MGNMASDVRKEMCHHPAVLHGVCSERPSAVDAKYMYTASVRSIHTCVVGADDFISSSDYLGNKGKQRERANATSCWERRKMEERV